MSETDRIELARRIVASLPKFGTWATSFRDFATPYGRLGYRQLAVLWVLRFEQVPPDEISPSRLAAIFRVQPSVVTGALARLEEGGFITRTVDPEDSRVYRIAITTRGVDVSQYVEDYFDQEVLDELRELSDADITQLRHSVELLDRIADALARRRPGRSSGPT